MEISVKMTAEEFQEFMTWQADKEKYFKEVERLRRAPECIAASIRWAVEPVEGKAAKFKIVSQEHMGDVWDMAEEFMPKK